jgi:hypothetical protein
MSSQSERMKKPIKTLSRKGQAVEYRAGCVDCGCMFFYFELNESNDFQLRCVKCKKISDCSTPHMFKAFHLVRY